MQLKEIKLSKRVERLQWILPSVIIIFVIVYQTWFVNFIHDTISENAHYIVELLLYGAMGPTVTFVVLTWIRRWLVEKESMEDQVREQERRLALLRVEEGKKVAQHLHREVLPNLAYVANKMDHTRSKHLIHDHVEQANEALLSVSQILRDTIGELREKINLLRRGAPLNGFTEGSNIVQELHEKAEEFRSLLHLDVRVEVLGTLPELDYEVAASIWRMVNEALNNTALHAQAKHVRVTLDGQQPDKIRWTVKDDGKGFQLSQWKEQPSGLGLIHITEEAEKWDCSLDIQTGHGQGTVLSAQLNIENEG